jgi:hypothetical protein
LCSRQCLCRHAYGIVLDGKIRVRIDVLALPEFRFYTVVYGALLVDAIALPQPFACLSAPFVLALRIQQSPDVIKCVRFHNHPFQKEKPRLASPSVHLRKIASPCLASLDLAWLFIGMARQGFSFLFSFWFFFFVVFLFLPGQEHRFANRGT